ncbi:hypothetical protein ABVF11_01400 [Pediococcus argentinicus]|uniref:hypothetical protein n=1 Tax=Pediococcus argentinicus TaxID=480391 RepID=UPI00338DACC6
MKNIQGTMRVLLFFVVFLLTAWFLDNVWPKNYIDWRSTWTISLSGIIVLLIIFIWEQFIGPWISKIK